MQNSTQHLKDEAQNRQSQEYEVSLRVTIKTEYQAFDLSGQLPFNIIFGISYRVKPGSNARPILLNTAASAFDVPYALANGFLSLFEGKMDKVDLSGFDAPAAESKFLAVQPMVNARALDVSVVYKVQIGPGSALAKFLHTDRKYHMRIANPNDFGVKWWAYGQADELLRDGKPVAQSEPARLVGRKGTGKAPFRVVDSLSWPPPFAIRMRLRPRQHDNDSVSCILELSITNRGADTITVQSSGHQRFLVRWGPYQPEPVDRRTRITSTIEDGGKQCLVITNAETGEDMYRYRPPICVLTVSGVDIRPKRRDLTVFEPGKEFKKEIDLSDKLTKLPDGLYKVELDPMHAWWCSGGMAEIYGSEAPSGEERISKERHESQVPPLRLSCDDIVELNVIGGKYHGLSQAELRHDGWVVV
ncbi:hypothetical protein BJ170DRAFT_615723 [Xylariales sp. AK1849]|nr:hypothetical protein BJ170DRAFT_615723 [Xylariales sp. AK1849]